jgi:hypothetical protein
VTADLVWLVGFPTDDETSAGVPCLCDDCTDRIMSADDNANVQPSELACDRCGRTVYWCRCRI